LAWLSRNAQEANRLPVTAVYGTASKEGAKGLVLCPFYFDFMVLAG